MSETPWPARGCELYGHRWFNKEDCRCGAPYVEPNAIEQRIASAVRYHLHDEAGRDQHAVDVGRNIARALGLTEEVGYAIGDDEPDDGQPDAWFSACDVADSEDIASKLNDGRRLFSRFVTAWTPRTP